MWKREVDPSRLKFNLMQTAALAPKYKHQQQALNMSFFHYKTFIAVAAGKKMLFMFPMLECSVFGVNLSLFGSLLMVWS